MNTIIISNKATETDPLKQIEVFYKLDSLNTHTDNVTVMEVQGMNTLAGQAGLITLVPFDTTIEYMKNTAFIAGLDFFYNNEKIEDKTPFRIVVNFPREITTLINNSPLISGQVHSQTSNGMVLKLEAKEGLVITDILDAKGESTIDSDKDKNKIEFGSFLIEKEMTILTIYVKEAEVPEPTDD